MLGEPPRSQYDLNFSLFGIPVRVHPLFWLVAVVLRGGLRDAGDVAIWTTAVFLSVLVHELGHAVAMRVAGFRPWIVLYGLGGLTSYDRDYEFRPGGLRPIGQILISFAGPAAGFLLAGVILAALVVAGYGVMIVWVGPWGVPLVPLLRFFPNERICDFIDYVLLTSVLWGCVNLLPVYPLDGGQIARETCLAASPRNGIRWSLWLSISVAVVIAAIGAVDGLYSRDWSSLYLTLLFGYLAFASYTTLQAYNGR